MINEVNEEKIQVVIFIPKSVYYCLLQEKGTKSSWYEYLIEPNLESLK